MHKVAVIIPAFNAAKTIERTLRSVVKNMCAITVIIVDDCSKDKTTDVAKSVVAKIAKTNNIDFVFTRHDSKRGPQAARRSGIEIAFRHKCTHVMMVDSDDTISDNAIDRCLKCANETDADIVQMRIDFIITPLHLHWPKSCKYDKSLALEAMLYDESLFPVQVCGKLYTSSLLKFATPITETENCLWGEDRLFNLPIMHSKPTIAIERKAVYNYFWCGVTRRKATADILKQYRQVHKLKRQFAIDKNLVQHIPAIDSELEGLIKYHATCLINQGSYSQAKKLVSPTEYKRLKHSPQRIFKKYIKMLLHT